LLKFLFFHKEGKFINSKVFLKMPQPKQSPACKSLNDVKVKYSPIKKPSNKHNNVYVKGYKFGLMTLEFRKFSYPNEDAYKKILAEGSSFNTLYSSLMEYLKNKDNTE